MMLRKLEHAFTIALEGLGLSVFFSKWIGIESPETPVEPLHHVLRQQWQQSGFEFFKDLVWESDVRALVTDVIDFRTKYDLALDERGHGKRIGLLHKALESLFKCALNSEVRRFVRWAFEGANPILFGSRTFDIGTEQEGHSDWHFFHTLNPNQNIHGSLPRANPQLTRRSMVVHYAADRCTMYHQYGFFRTGDRLTKHNPIVSQIANSCMERCVWHQSGVLHKKGNDHYKA